MAGLLVGLGAGLGAAARGAGRLGARAGRRAAPGAPGRAPGAGRARPWLRGARGGGGQRAAAALAGGAGGPAGAGPSVPSPAGGGLEEVRFHQEADAALDALLEAFEDLLDGPEGEGLEGETDATLAAGVLELRLGDRGTFVLNKQAPNRQIWLSSPISGPLRYDFCGERRVWVYGHDGSLLHPRLEEELSQLLGVPVLLPSPPPL